MHIQFEGFWRPKTEIVPAVVCLFCAAVIMLAPAFFLLSATAAVVIGGCIAGMGLWRLLQYLDLDHRQRNLLRQPAYVLKSSELPVSKKRLFFGMGYEWQTRHAQRLYELRTYGTEYMKKRGAAKIMDDICHWLDDKSLLPSPVKNTLIPPNVGGESCIHGVEIEESEQSMSLAERVGHTLVIGTTGVGKTRCAEQLITQDIRRGGNVVIILDPKGDLDLLKRISIEAKNCGRQNELTILHLGYPECSARYNPLGDFSRITEVATRVANQLPGSGQSATFKQFAWRYVNMIAKTLIALGERPTYDRVKYVSTSMDALVRDYYKLYLKKNVPDWEERFTDFCGYIDDPDNKEYIIPREMKNRDKEAVCLVLFVREHYPSAREQDEIISGIEDVIQYDRSYFDKLVASLLPFLEKVTTGRINELLSPDYEDMEDQRPIFTWSQVLNRNGIVYVGLDTLTDPEVGSAVGYAMFSDLKSMAGYIYKEGRDVGAPDWMRRPANLPIIVHADEMSEIAGSEVTGLLNKGRGAGFQLTLYTQSIADTEVKLGSAAEATQQYSNLNNLVMMRVREEKTAQFLTKALPEVDVYNVTLGSATSTDGDGRLNVRNEDKISAKKTPLVATSDMLKLPKGHAFCYVEGGRLIKVRMPLIQETDPVHANLTVREIMRDANGIDMSFA